MARDAQCAENGTTSSEYVEKRGKMPRDGKRHRALHETCQDDEDNNV